MNVHSLSLWIIVSWIGTLMLPLPLAAQNAETGNAAGRQASAREEAHSDDLEAEARAFIELLGQGDFEQATANFDDAMRQGLPPEKLKQVWTQLIREVGPLKQQQETVVRTAGEFRVVDVTCEFERRIRIVRVSFTGQGEIGGLFFLPPNDGSTGQLNLLLVVSFVIAVGVQIGVPLLLALLLWRRLGCRWRFWLIGLLVFLLFQGVTRIPAVLAIQAYPPFQQLLQQPAYLWTWIALLSVTAGLFEEGGRALAYRYVIAPRDRNWSMAVMFGAGHGGLESIAVGLSVLTSLIGYLVITAVPVDGLGIPQEAIAVAREQFSALHGWEPLLGGWERVCALCVHLALSVMVLQAFVRSKLWWWCALLAHSLFNFTAVGLLQIGTAAWGRSTAMLAAEGLATVCAVLAVWYVMAMRPRITAKELEQTARFP